MATKKRARGKKPASRAPKKPSRAAATKAARAAPRKARPAPRKRAKPAVGKPAARPTQLAATSLPSHVPHNARPAIKRRARARGIEVAEVAPGGMDAMEAADHAHQDPRFEGEEMHDQTILKPDNYGSFKNKAAARNDKPVNWFRRGAKPKQA